MSDRPDGSREPEAVSAGTGEPDRRLRRSRTDRIVAGVCGGIGHAYGIDPVLVRIGFVLLVFLPGIGPLTVLLLYIAGAILMPQETSVQAEERRRQPSSRPLGSTSVRVVLGGVLIAFGALLLVRIYLPEILSLPVLGPLVLIVAGLLIAFQGVRR